LFGMVDILCSFNRSLERRGRETGLSRRDEREWAMEEGLSSFCGSILPKKKGRRLTETPSLTGTVCEITLHCLEDTKKEASFGEIQKRKKGGLGDRTRDGGGRLPKHQMDHGTTTAQICG